MPDHNFLLFEQPANEIMRVFLRLEYLHQKAQYFLTQNEWYARTCVATIIEMLNVLDRPDLRNKITQEVSRLISNMQRLAQTPHVDLDKLETLIFQLEKTFKILQGNNGRFAETLREHDFIKNLTFQLNTAGGLSDHNLPGFQLWLAQPGEYRMATLQNWLGHFKEIYEISQLLLNLARESGKIVTHEAISGFYQINLDPKISYQLIRIWVPLSMSVFPKVSHGKYGASLSFHEANLVERCQQTTKNIPFEYAACAF